MVIINLDHNREVAYFTSATSKGFFLENFQSEISNVAAVGAWTVLTLTKVGSLEGMRIVCRLVDHDLGGVLVETKEILRGKSQPGDGIFSLTGTPAYYAYAERRPGSSSARHRKSPLCFYDFNVMKSVFEKGFGRCVAQPARAVIWFGEKVPTLATGGFIIKKDCLWLRMKEVIEKEEEMKGILDESPL